MNPTLTVTAAVLTYNGDYLLPDCLDSIERQPYITNQLIVDNGSDVPIPPHRYTSWTIHHEYKNRGNIGGQNLCFDMAETEWVLFVANDVRLLDECTKWMWLWAKTIRTPGQIQPEIYTPWGTVDQMGMDWIWPGYGISRKSLFPYRPGIVPSTCYLMRKAVWKEMGGFDESLVSSHEDVDMGLRLRKAGYTSVVAPGARAIHLVNQTLRHTIENPRRTFQEARLKVIKKHYEGSDRLIRLSTLKAIYATFDVLHYRPFL